jgi:RHS repeat-associated protein
VPQSTLDGSSSTTYPVDVTVTNTSSSTWSSRYVAFHYRWFSPDPTPVVIDGGTMALSSSVAAGGQVVFHPVVTAPTLPVGVERGSYKLRFDLYDSKASVWFAAAGNQPLDNPVIVNHSLSDGLGLERYYHYLAAPLGAGMDHLVNVANGNSLLHWTPFDEPGRGLATIADITYNSLEKKSDSPLGNNFSLSVSTLSRFGLPLDIHPNKADQIAGRSNRWIAFVDGDGTPHRFDGQLAADGSIFWTDPPGLHLYLHQVSTDTTAARYWAITRPDGATFYYDAGGYPTSTSDRNGNTITYAESAPASPDDDPGKLGKMITAVTDAGGRAFTLSYYTKDTAPKAQIRGKIQSITDHAGEELDFNYYNDGNLRQITERGGASLNGSNPPDRTFTFTYTTSDGSGPAIAGATARLNPDPGTSNESTRLYSVIDPRGNETTFAYVTSGQDKWKLASTTDRAGNATTYAYDDTNQATTALLPLNRRWTYAYNAGGQVTRITDPLGRLTTQTWSPDLQLVRVTEPTGGSTSYAYNDNGLPTDLTDQLGNHSVWTYANAKVDANDTTGKWSAGRTIPHISDLASATSPKGVATTALGDYTTTYTIDSRGNVTKVTDPTGAFTTMTYNADGTVATSTDANGNLSIYTDYDPSGQPTRTVDAAAGVEQRGYSLDGKLIWIQDPLHASATGADPHQYRTYFDYDVLGRNVRTTTPKSTSLAPGTLIVSRRDYDANDNTIAEYRDDYGAPGPKTTMTYDAMDRLTQAASPNTEIDPNGERKQYVYDAAGRLILQTDPKGVLTANTPNDFATFYGYDAADQLTETTQTLVDAAGTVTNTLNTFYCYTAGGDLRWFISPRANLMSVDCAAATTPEFTTSHTYDLAHQELSSTDAAGRTTSSSYDANGNVETETNESGNVTTDAYNQRDDLVTVVRPFDTAATPARTLTTTYEYDGFGNVKREISPRGYDASGDKATFTDYVTSYAYDRLERLVRIDLPTSAAYPTPQYVHRAYDANGDLTLYTLPGTSPDPAGVAANKKMTLTYLDPGWIDTSKTPHLPRFHYDYAADGQPTSRTPEDQAGNLDSAHADTWSYNVDGAPQTYIDRAGRTTTFGHDVNGNLTSEVHTSVPAGSGITVDYGYDGLDRVAKVSTKRQQDTNDMFTSFAYDENDNIVQREQNGVEDPNGNPISSGRKADLTWDAVDELTQQVDYGWSSGSSDDARLTKTYGPTGVVKTATLERPATSGWAAESSTAYTYNADDSLASATTQNGAGTVIESHALSYVDANGQYVNGNVTNDVFTLAGPNPAAPCRASTCTSSYAYDPRERLAEQQTIRDGVTKTTDYTLDSAGNVTLLDNNGDQTSFAYNGDQLTSRTHGTDTRNYWYDGSGNLDCVTRPTGSADDCNTSSPNVLADYGYDGVDRLKSVRTYHLDGTRDRTTDYSYDVLNRVGQQTESHGDGTPRTTSFDYLSASDLVNSEQAVDGTGAVLDKKGYSYDAGNTPFDLTDTPTGGSPARSDFEYDPHGSASLLLDPSGSAAASYGYTPYGAADAQLSSGDDNSDDPTNPVRYTGKRYDSGSGNLVMGPRQFSPDDAHFLQGDKLPQPTDDAGLTESAHDQNRYALAGGNPVNYRDADGHMVVADAGGGALVKPKPVYMSPFTGDTALRPGRTDQGVDYNGIGPIRVIGDAHIDGDSYSSGWYGHFLRYRLKNGRHAGKLIYIAESIIDVPTASNVKRGTVIARFGPNAQPRPPHDFPGTEMGWASPTMNLTWASYTYPPLRVPGTNHNNLPAGKAFARFLRHLGVRTECPPGPGPEFVGWVAEVSNPSRGC